MIEEQETNSHESPVILVVDDSPIERHLAGTLLREGLHARIVTAVNGRDALEQLRALIPSLVLTDLQMPEMDGLQLVAEIRTHYPSLPVVLMTGNGSEELALRALAAGAASYVPKHLLTVDLVPTIEHILANRAERRQSHIIQNITRIECEFDLENDPSLVPHLVAHIQEQMIRMKLCNENGKIRIGVALEEALLNGIYHGNLELSSDLRNDDGNRFEEMAAQRRTTPPYCDRRLHVKILLTADEACFTIRDEGPGFDVRRTPDPTTPENMLLCSGRGLLLIRTFMDEVSHNETGNRITMRKRCLKER